MDQSENTGWQSEAMISLRNLRVSYGEHELLHGISFDVQRGETLVILGGLGSRERISPPSPPRRWTKSARKSECPSRAARCSARCRLEKMLRCHFANTPSWKTQPSKSSCD